jgi:hypothetical protein
MKSLLWIVTFAGLSVTLGFSAASSIQARPSGSHLRVGQALTEKQKVNASQEERTEPTVEETRDFILKHTRGQWQDREGNVHAYALGFSGKKLKFTRRFTSKFISGFVEKIQVQLDDLDPNQVGKEEPDSLGVYLATTNGARKIAIEVEMFGPTDGPTIRKYLARNMAVPGSDLGESDAQDKMNARLKKAWTHLIKLAGGKPSKKEPF